jgi:hypothetical protein
MKGKTGESRNSLRRMSINDCQVTPALKKNIIVKQMPNFNSLLTITSDVVVLFALFSLVFVLHMYSFYHS